MTHRANPPPRSDQAQSVASPSDQDEPSRDADRGDPDEHAIREATLSLLASRKATSTICPSEVARQLAPGDWRPLMPRIREIAAKLAAEGIVQVTRSGVEVEATSKGGPIRIGRKPNHR